MRTIYISCVLECVNMRARSILPYGSSVPLTTKEIILLLNFLFSMLSLRNKRFQASNTQATNVINWYKASGYTVYLLVNSKLKITLHIQMFYIYNISKVYPSPTLSSFWCQECPLTKAFVLLAPFSDQANITHLP